jgi:hypothetical protein
MRLLDRSGQFFCPPGAFKKVSKVESRFFVDRVNAAVSHEDRLFLDCVLSPA